MGGSRSWLVTTLPILVARGIMVRETQLFLVVEGQDSTYSRLNPSLMFISKAHDMSCSHIRKFKVKIALTQIYISVSSESCLILITGVLGNDLRNKEKKLLPVYSKPPTGRKEKKKEKKMVIAKRFALYANAIIQIAKNLSKSPH